MTPRRLFRLCAMALLSLTLAGPEGRAQSVPPSPEEDGLFVAEEDRRYFDAAEFRQVFENKTAHLQSATRHYGSEYYIPGDRSVWVASDEPCRPGDWVYEPPQFCFRYGADGPFCWTIFEANDEIYAESEGGLLLKVYAVDERPLSCDPELLSAVPDRLPLDLATLAIAHGARPD